MLPDTTAQSIVDRIARLPKQHKRRLVALVGPPASGKSTLAEQISAALPQSCVVPMDGFHLDDTLLRARGLLSRKGAPETFDVSGLKHLLERLRDEDEVIYPVFDRTTERAIAGAGLVTVTTQTVVVEGNYLLLNAPTWRDFAALWDFSVFLRVPEPELRARLMTRWHGLGYSDAQASQKTDGNDLENARTVMTQALPADLVIENV